MSAYFVRQGGERAIGPYEPEQIKGWIAEGRLTRETECSTDGQSWTPAGRIEEIGGAAPAKAAPASSQGFPEPSLLIRQGANIQGPYAMTRIRGYVAQRRIQPYMLFSQDGVFWLGPEHVPGLIPDGYVALPPPRKPTAVPSSAAEAAAATAAPATPPPAPGKDVGSTTLFGYRLEEADLAPKAIPASRPASAAGTSAPPPPPASAEESTSASAEAEPAQEPGAEFTYYVRDDQQQVYGPYTEDALREWIAEGRVRADMEYSMDGRTWTLGTKMPALFPGAVSNRIPGSRRAADSLSAQEPAAPSVWKRFRGRR